MQIPNVTYSKSGDATTTSVCQVIKFREFQKRDF
jgi:hypothetical protein